MKKSHRIINKHKKARFRLLILALLCLASLNGMTTPGYHFQIDFSNESSDNISGWSTNLRSDHPKGGVQVISGLYARFRNGVAAMKTNSAYSNAGTLSFTLKRDDYGTNNPTFKVYTSTDGTDWDTGWTEVFSTNYDDLSTEGNLITVEINSGNSAVYIKLESINDDMGDSGTEYSFQLDDLELSDSTPFSSDNVDVAEIIASCMTVSSEVIQFSEVDDNVFIAHDSIAFDAICNLSCVPLSPSAKLEEIVYANPYPGSSDTAVYRITSEDNTKTILVKAIVARSLYQTKFGFLKEITNQTKEYDGWTFGGKRYPSSSKGNGAAYPGENAMRLYDSKGYITTPKFSSVSTLSFVAKFSKTDGESLKIQKSFNGIDFTDIISYSPGDGPIPSYTAESVSDPLSETLTLDINEKDVYIRFQYVNGNSSEPRTMIDDIACMSIYDPNETFDVLFRVKDFYNNVVEGAHVKLGSDELLTDSEGVALFSDLPYQMEALPYAVTKTDFLVRSGSLFVRSDIAKRAVLTREELDIFLALGQSNMAGRADIAEFTDTIPGAYILNSDDIWVSAKNPMNIYSNIRKDADMQKLGPSFSFARTLREYVDRPICIITNARGGTSISALAKGGEYHQALMDRVSMANDFGTVKGIIWHQGETNSNNFASYLGLLNSLVEDIRESVNTNFYFVAGQLGPWYSKYEDFNINLTNIQNTIEHSDYVINDRLWHRGDSTHFNTHSQLLLGTRYAQKVLEETYDINIGIYEFSLPDNLFVTNGNDTIHSGDRILYTTPWSEDLTFKIHSANDQKFDSLTINDTQISVAKGELSYEFMPTSRDSMFTIEATFKIETNTGVEDVIRPLNFHPNPASDIIFFKGGNGVYNATVYDMSGRIMLEKNRSSEIDISSIKPGYYIMFLKSGNKKLSGPLLIQ